MYTDSAVPGIHFRTSTNAVQQTVNVRYCAPFGWSHAAVVSGVRCMNEVNTRRDRLVLGWMTVCGRVYHLGM